MNLLQKIKAKWFGGGRPEHLRRGELGERAAEKYLKELGLKSGILIPIPFPRGSF